MLSQGLLVDELKNWIQEYCITSVKLRKKEGGAYLRLLLECLIFEL
jgi:hypothetical protein